MFAAAVPSPPTPWLAYACLAASMALVGTYVGLSKWLLEVLPVFLLAWLRFSLAAIAMLGWLRRPAEEPTLTRRDRQLLFLESLLGNFLFSICMLYGMAWSTALAAGIVMAALPAAVALLSRVFLKERLSVGTLAGIVCAVTGIALVAADRHGASPASNPTGTWLGPALLLGAVFCEASYVVLGKRLSGRLGPKRISALVNLWGLALVTPLGLWQAQSFDFATVLPSMWALLVFYALAASMITVWLWMHGLRHVPAARAGVFTIFLPLSAAAVGVLVLGEPVSVRQGAAFALALLGVVLATWPSRID